MAKTTKKNNSTSQQIMVSAMPVGINQSNLPPSAPEVEQAVLGAMLIEKEAIAKAISILNTESFYKREHQLIYEAMISLFESGEPVDVVTVYEELKKRNHIERVGGAAYISQLSQNIASAALIETHARILVEKQILRSLIQSAHQIAKEAYDGNQDAFEILDSAERKIFEISELQMKRNYQGMDIAVKNAIEYIEAIHSQTHRDFAVPTGFYELDEILGGFQKSDLIIIAARPSMGKCLGKGTKVLMYDGSLKKVEDVKVGDLLMGDDSTPRRVLSIARGREMMYWVRQKHGIDYRVNESHILSLKRSRNENSHRKGEIVNISVKNYLTKSKKWKSNYKGYKTEVEFEHKPVPIDPYFLGLWLGDGKSDGSRIYTTDNEVVEYLYEYASELGSSISVVKDRNKCPAYIITGGKTQNSRNSSLQAKLRKLNLINNKHIPELYLRNDKATRLKLLAGLIDSDGFVNHPYGGTIVITSKYEELAKQIKFLCDTLGYRTSLKSKKAKISSTGFETTVWRVRFNGNVDEIPIRIKRKKTKQWTDHRDWQVTAISVEPDKIDDYYGFVLDGNHLFLLEDCTVTHNTAFALTLARNAAIDHKVPVGIFSLEMSTMQLVIRLLCAEGRLNAHLVRTGKLPHSEGQKLSKNAHKLISAPIYVDDSPSQTVLEIRAKARRLKAEKKIGLVIIDYLQLMQGPAKAESREREISHISRSLKALAKELNIPVIALAQLNRAVESRSDKRPQLSDLRESGSIEQDADVVMFLNRPEYYGIEKDENGESLEGVAEVIIGKQRNGPTGTVKLAFIKEYARFENLAHARQIAEYSPIPEEDII